MSWIRTAVNRAVEVGGNNNLTRTVRSYADSVVQHAGSAVVGGAKMLQDRIAARNMQNFRVAVKRLEEVSVSCKGVERVQLLRRWLVALKEVDRLYNDQNNQNDSSNKDINENDDKNNSNKINSDNTNNDDNDKNVDDQFSFEEYKDSPKKPTLVYYFDPEIGETMNFGEVFLYSQALEGMTLSMILEAPNDEEVSLFMEIFRICLAGGKEVHEAVMTSIKSLATTFSTYQDEVLVKREELLQYAQDAIAGIKLNAHLARIDAETCSLKEKLGEMKALQDPSSEGHEESSDKQTAATIEALIKEALGFVRLYSRLEELLLKKRSLSNGDSPQIHAEKVDKLKVLSESLVNSTSKAEKRILEQRFQKEEALHFRLAKTNEVSQQEKELEAGIRELERQKDDLEAELKMVSASLTIARARLRNAREEREHFDDASNQILLQLKLKEEELSKSIALCRAEADVVNKWINFMEDTWILHSTFNEQKEKQVNGELDKYGEYFLNQIIHLLSAFKEQMVPSISRIRQLAENLRLSERSGRTAKDESQQGLSPRKTLEEYVNLESTLITTFSVVDSIKEQFYSPNEAIHRKNDERVKNLFDDLERTKEEFESIEKPTLKVETTRLKSQSPSSAKSQISSPWARLKASAHKVTGQKKPGFELDNDDGELSEYETEEIGEWEYDAFEKDHQPNT